MNKVLSDERLGAKLRVTKNRCVLFNSLTYVYLALLPQHWALYAKVDTTPIFIYICTDIFFFRLKTTGNTNRYLQNLKRQYWCSFAIRVRRGKSQLHFGGGPFGLPALKEKKVDFPLMENTIKNWRIKRQTRSNISVCKLLRTHLVVLRPIGAHLKLNSDPGFFIPSFKSHFETIFFTLFEESNNHQDYSQ